MLAHTFHFALKPVLYRDGPVLRLVSLTRPREHPGVFCCAHEGQLSLCCYCIRRHAIRINSRKDSCSIRLVTPQTIRRGGWVRPTGCLQSVAEYCPWSTFKMTADCPRDALTATLSATRELYQKINSKNGSFRRRFHLCTECLRDVKCIRVRDFTASLHKSKCVYP